MQKSFEARLRVIGLGQGILGMKSGKRTILQKMLNLLFLMMLAKLLFSGFFC